MSNKSYRPILQVIDSRAEMTTIDLNEREPVA
jgi:hypothetical protein